MFDNLFVNLLNPPSLDESSYSILGIQGAFELRLYPRKAYASISLEGSFSKALSEGKKILLDYAEGTNFKAEKIIFSQSFIFTKSPANWEIGFFLQTEMNKTPMPINRLIKLSEMSPGKVGVIKFTGMASEDFINMKEKELNNWLARNNHMSRGPCRYVFDESQLNLPYRRNKEIHINVL